MSKTTETGGITKMNKVNIGLTQRELSIIVNGLVKLELWVFQNHAAEKGLLKREDVREIIELRGKLLEQELSSNEQNQD